MTKLENGQRYPARATGAASVYENAKESLIVCIEVDVQGEMLRYYATIATKDNGVNTRTVEGLKAMFGWDGQDPFWFVDHGAECAEREVEATIELAPWRNGDNMFANVKYLDPPGGQSGASQMPAAGNRAALLAKYGSKFRAIAGGTPAGKPAQDSLPLAKAPPSKPPTIKSLVNPSDQGACWARYCELGGTEDKWFDALADAVPGVDQGDLTASQWGMVLAHIETNMLPM